MYQVLSESRVTINHHGSVAPYANNLRLFEATGLEAALVTDQRRMLDELFVLGSEVIFLRHDEGLRWSVGKLLSSPTEVIEVGSAGQARTNRDHLWSHRIPEMMTILEGSF